MQRAGPVVRELVVEEDRPEVHEAGHDLPGGDGGPLRAVAVLELPRAERHPVEQVEPLLDAHDLRRRSGARLLLGEQPPLRLVGEPLLLAQRPPALPQRRERRLVLALHPIEELDDGRRHEERVERVVGIVRQEVHERRARLGLVAEVVLGDPEDAVRLDRLAPR